MCFFTIDDSDKQEIPVRTIRKRYLTAEVAANFIDILTDTPSDVLPSSCDFIVENFNSKLRSALDIVAPIKIKKLSTKSKPPWKNDHTNNLKRNCRKAERKWRKNKIQINYNIFKYHLKAYNTAIKQERRKHFSTLIHNNQNNPKVLFKTIDQLINPDFKQTQSSDLSCDDFAVHFSSKIDFIRSNLLLSQPLNFNPSEALFLSEETLESFVLVDNEMLEKVFKQLKVTTCLLDPIPASLFKTFYDFFKQDFLTILQFHFRQAYFPLLLKLLL